MVLHYIYTSYIQKQASSDCLHSTLPAALYQTLSPTAAAVAMKMITQLVILTLALLLVNAHDKNEYCTNLFKQYKIYKSNCSPVNTTVENCCDLCFTGFSLNKSPSAVYHMTSCTAPSWHAE